MEREFENHKAFFVVRYCAEIVPELHSVAGALCSGGRVSLLSSLWDAVVGVSLKTKHFGFSRNILNHFASDSFICKAITLCKMEWRDYEDSKL